jgi:hypothetical protein
MRPFLNEREEEVMFEWSWNRLLHSHGGWKLVHWLPARPADVRSMYRPCVFWGEQLAPVQSCWVPSTPKIPA